MINLTHNDCLGVVLAGGLSSRMGEDKAQLLRNKQTLLEFSKQMLIDSGVKHTVVSGDKYDVPDRLKESGPVGGILSVLASYPQVKSLLILPVDLPLITAKALSDLRQKGEISQKAVHFNDHFIPLYLPNNAYLELFLQQAFTAAADLNHQQPITQRKGRFQRRGPSMKALLAHVPHQTIQCRNTNILLNMNTPQEWQQTKQKHHF